jgi:hypothetical protein
MGKRERDRGTRERETRGGGGEIEQGGDRESEREGGGRER